MIIADTNVWSESLRPAPDARVLEWMRATHRELFMTVTTLHELRTGVLLLPEGRRRRTLGDTLDAMLTRMAPRILPYDSAAAVAHASIRARAQAAGRGLSSEDGQILGIAMACGAAVATRNAGDVEAHGVEIIDPWTAA